MIHLRKLLLPVLWAAGGTWAAVASTAADAGKAIRISTKSTDLVLQVAANGRLYQTYLGDRLADADELTRIADNYPSGAGGNAAARGWDVASCSGNESYFEPAWALTHADGNPTTYLYYQSSETRPVDGGQETVIRLRDNRYPVDVTLHYVAYEQQDVIKTWSELRHDEKGTVSLSAYASTMLYLSADSYYLTEFSGDWAHEAGMSSQPLRFGKKIIDTKLGARAGMHTSPFFEVGIDGPVRENEGRVLMGTLAWTGNFRFTFEVDNRGDLRVLPAINPYASVYPLRRGQTFVTPAFIFTLSRQGTGQGSRRLHEWARRYQIYNGGGERMTLLNNWENTGFNFDEARLGQLMHEARDLGVDLFLLDDGWFGNKYPRANDGAGLGDWAPTREKLPHGIAALADTARKVGVKFGIWVEPEMVNPKSELMERHPDWAIRLPNRDTYYYRNQLVLDLANPEVQDYVFGVVDGIMKACPDVAYFKWDCNSPITNIYSPYLKKEQGRLYIDYVRGLYRVLDRIRERYPSVPIMICSGGGARCDYEALRYGGEFWCSDNTDPFERLYIQWGFSQFLPAKAMCAHVTSWNRRTSVKFRTDVASMCKLGFDIGLEGMSETDREFCRQAVKNWKRLSPAIMDGRQYRLVSPYEGHHMAVNYVSADGRQAVLFVYDLHPRFDEPLHPVRLQGLEPDRRYRVSETNLMPGRRSSLRADGKVYTGRYLMNVGLDVLSTASGRSCVVELTAE